MKKAQQIIEFLLIMPFVIAILGIMSEFAYAFNINMTLQKACEYASSQAYLYPADDELEAKITQTLKEYLDEHYVPYIDTVKVEIVKVDKSAIVTASYTYTSAFTLPNIFVNVIPEEFNFSAMAALPGAYVNEGKFELSDSDTKFFITSKGILKEDIVLSDGIYAREHIAFLVPIENPLATSSIAHALVRYDGTNFIENAHVQDLKEIIQTDGTVFSSLLDYLTLNNIQSTYVVDSSSLGTISAPTFDISTALALKNQETSNVFGLYEDIESIYANNAFILNLGSARLYSNGEITYDSIPESNMEADVGEAIERN